MKIERSSKLLGVLAMVCVVAGNEWLIASPIHHERHELSLIDYSARKNEAFGTSVAMDKGIALIGAIGVNRSGPNSGAAYVLDVASGERLAELTPVDGDAHDRFGSAVAVSDGVALIGSPRDDDDDGIDAAAGSAYLFDLSTGEQLFKLRPRVDDQFDEFGSAVALDGDLALVALINSLRGGREMVSVFDVATGELLSTLSLGRSTSLFGTAISLSEGIALIGAPRDDEIALEAGAAYLYDVVSGEQQRKLTVEDVDFSASFGAAVSIDGDLALIGAPGATVNGARTGAAYIYDVTTGEQLAKLTASDGDEGDRFGSSVSLRDGIAVVGASADDRYGYASGSAYVFDAYSGVELGTLVPLEGDEYYGFGSAVAIDRGVALVGAPSATRRFGDHDVLFYASRIGLAYTFNVVPEPTGVAIAAITVLSLVALRRRSA